MKNILLICFCFLALQNIQAQNVGINSTGATPNASSILDVSATDKGLLIPRVSLTSVTDAITIATPATSLLVYSTNGNTAQMPDSIGYYYNAGTPLAPNWVKLFTKFNQNPDADWYKTGTTTAPTSINDTMFHMGNVGIGENTPEKPLVVESSSVGDLVRFTTTANLTSTNKTGLEIGMQDQGSGTSTAIIATLNGTSNGNKRVIRADITNNSNNAHIGTNFSFFGTSTGSEMGHSYFTSTSGTGDKAGYVATFNNPNGIQTGLDNNFFGANTATNYGVNNFFSSRASIKYGVFNLYNSNDSGSFYGMRNDVTTFRSGTGSKYGLYNDFAGNGDAIQYGVYNYNNVNGDGIHYGNYNFFDGLGTGIQVGVQNHFVNYGGNTHYGVRNLLSASNSGDKYGLDNFISIGNGMHYGVNNNIQGNGSGYHFGIKNVLIGTGNGLKYASYDSIGFGAGGRGFGVFSSALDTLNDYAGFFRGKLSIGMAYNNNYVFPTTRGTNNQIMVTDNTGKVSWQDARSTIDTVAWLITGNAGTNPTTNFLGTLDANPLVFRYNNVFSGVIDSGLTRSTALGYRALTNYATTAFNTAIGYASMSSPFFAAQYNTGIGVNTLRDNRNGSHNFAGGYGALISNINGSRNVAIGHLAASINTVGSDNIAIGNYALRFQNFNNGNIEYSTFNVAVGGSALYNNNPTTTANGIFNTAIGDGVLYRNTIGQRNTSVGARSSEYNTTGDWNTALGVDAMRGNLGFNQIGNNNVAVGGEALFRNGAGNENIAIGKRALFFQDFINGGVLFDSRNTAVGSYSLYNNNPTTSTNGINNTAVGSEASRNNTTGINNTSLGVNAANNNNTGSNNVAIGDSALYSNTASNITAIGSKALKNNVSTWNTAVGYQSMYSNTVGYSNTSIGFLAMFNNLGGYRNTASGVEALRFNTTGYHNAAFGAYALYRNIEGWNNSSFGSYSLYSNTFGSHNTAIGNGAMFSQSFDNGGVTYNTGNTAVGFTALYSNNPTSVDNGINNTSVGSNSLYANSIGYSNTAVGYYTLTNNTEGIYNDALGNAALGFNTIGNYNVSLGANSSYRNTTSSRNVAIGFEAIRNFSFSNGNNIWNSNNIGIGYQTLFNLNATATTNGINNVALGTTAGNTLTTGANNTLLGSNTNVNTSTLTYAAAIGSGATVDCNNCLALGGNTVATRTKVGINNNTPTFFLDLDHPTGFGNGIGVHNTSATSGWEIYQYSGTNLGFNYNGANLGTINSATGAYVATSDRRLKTAIQPAESFLDKVMKLQVQRYEYKKNNPTHRQSIGFIAQDVEPLFPEFVYKTDMTKDDPNNEIKEQYSMDYAGMSAIAIKAIQEQQKIIEQQSNDIESLKKQMEELKQLIKTK